MVTKYINAQTEAENRPGKVNILMHFERFREFKRFNKFLRFTVHIIIFFLYISITGSKRTESV